MLPPLTQSYAFSVVWMSWDSRVRQTVEAIGVVEHIVALVADPQSASVR
jgi:hypothetical protein